MEKDGDRQKKWKVHCSTGQSAQRAVMPVEEEEEGEYFTLSQRFIYMRFLDNKILRS
jgi:hypothetical protein